MIQPPTRRAAITSNAFNPRSMGLALWLEARLELLSNGASVGSPLELSGSGLQPTQATGSAKPQFVTNIQNDQPAYRFDGVDDRWTLSGLINGVSAFSFVAAFVARAASPSGNIWEHGSGVDRYQISATSTFQVNTSKSISIAQPVQNSALLVTGILTSSGLLSAWRNGVAIAPVTGATVPTATATFGIGARTNGTSAAQIDLFALFMIEKTLSNQERLMLEGYINKYHAIY